MLRYLLCRFHVWDANDKSTRLIRASTRVRYSPMLKLGTQDGLGGGVDGTVEEDGGIDLGVMTPEVSAVPKHGEWRQA